MSKKSGISGTSSQSFSIGNGTTADGYIFFNNADVNKPGLKYDDTTNKIQFSHNGTSWSDVNSFIAAGDLSGSVSSQNVIKIQNRSVADTSVLPRAGQQLTWSTTNNRWQYQWESAIGCIQDKAGRIGLDSGLLAQKMTPSFSDLGQIDNSSAVLSMAYLGNGNALVGFSYANAGDQGGAIYKTNDYGATWTKKYYHAFNGRANAVTYLGGGLCIAYEEGHNSSFVRSTDYGETWASTGVRFYSGLGPCNAMARCDGNVVIAVGAYGRIDRSTDLGINWSTVKTKTGESELYAVTYLGNGIVLAGGGDAGGTNILRSTDNGSTWTELYAYDDWNTGVTPNVPQTFASNVKKIIDCGGGKVIALTASGNAGHRISVSMDFGQTWAPTQLPADSPTFGTEDAIYCGNGRILGINGGNSIYESYDYGKTWHTLATNARNYQMRILHFDDGTIITGHLYGYICRATSVCTTYPEQPAHGGTGLSSYTTGDLIYASATNTLANRAIGPDGYVLKVSGGVPVWADSTVTVSHNSTTGLQGGTTNEYYHLTSAQHTWLTDGYTQGKWVETKGGTNQTTYATGDILYASGSNTLNKLSATTDGYVLTLVSGVPSWVSNSFTQVVVGNPNALSANTDGYLINMAESNDENFPAYVANTNCSLKNLTVTMSSAMSAGQTVQIIVRKNGMDTALTATLDDASPLNTGATLRIEQDLVNSISLVNGDRVNVRFISSATADAQNVFVTFDVVK